MSKDFADFMEKMLKHAIVIDLRADPFKSDKEHAELAFLNVLESYMTGDSERMTKMLDHITEYNPRFGALAVTEGARHMLTVLEAFDPSIKDIDDSVARGKAYIAAWNRVADITHKDCTDERCRHHEQAQRIKTEDKDVDGDVQES